MSNHLAAATSPYLLQHADQPVDWYPWGEEALEKAAREERPIFLSIGYAACHWCHVMAHETFDDPQIAGILNDYFVPIKVDREERPDLDAIYMSAVVALTGQGGWPMSVFLTPAQKPFYGGTYFPPQPRHGLPSFRQVLEAIAGTWRDDRERLHLIAEQLDEQLQSESIRSVLQGIDAGTLKTATEGMLTSFDYQTGGWGQAPKFPQPMSIDFLFTQATRGEQPALKTALRSLDAMMAGGMYDLLGGGFHRYSTDPTWLVPHFEKMLYDNAQLARAYLHAFQLTGQEKYRQVCEASLEFIERELTGAEGGFYSSLDADSPGGEGNYYLWSPDQVDQALADSRLRDLVKSFYGVTPGGNFEGRAILREQMTMEELAALNGLSSMETSILIEKARSQLLRYRLKREPPALDDKVISSWNGLALWAFAEAGAVLHNHHWIELAMRNAEFVLANLHPQQRLLRSWRRGAAAQPAFLEDYGALILGLISLYQANPQTRWFSSASMLLEEMLALFRDPNGGFFDTGTDQEMLIRRLKETQDNAVPSGSSLAVMALLKMAELTGEENLREQAEIALGQVESTAARYPGAFAFWLQALDFAVGPVQQVALVGDPDHPLMKAYEAYYHQVYRPRTVLAASPDPIPPGSPPLLAERTELNNLPAAYVCQGFTCQLPVTDLEKFRLLLSSPEENGSAPG